MFNFYRQNVVLVSLHTNDYVGVVRITSSNTKSNAVGICGTQNIAVQHSYTNNSTHDHAAEYLRDVHVQILCRDLVITIHEIYEL